MAIIVLKHPENDKYGKNSKNGQIPHLKWTFFNDFEDFAVTFSAYNYLITLQIYTLRSKKKQESDACRNIFLI